MALPHEFYCELISSGMSEGMCTDDQILWLRKHLRSCDRRIQNITGLYIEIENALHRSNFDIAPCSVCGEPVVCLPEGGALCNECADTMEDDQ